MNKEFCVEKQEDHFRLELDEIEEGERISIPMDIYVFPDNCILTSRIFNPQQVRTQ